MPIQTQNFTPVAQNHYQLAETWKEKDAAAERQMAIDAANNAAQAEREAMSLNADSAKHAASLESAGQQNATENNLNQQRINADVKNIGLKNALDTRRLQSTDRQNAIENARLDAVNKNNLEQQGLQNVRNAKIDANTEIDRQRQDIAWKRANDMQSKTYDLANIGSYLNKVKPDNNGIYDLSHPSIRTAIDAQTYGETSKAKNITGSVKEGNLEFYADGKLIDYRQPISAITLATQTVANGGKSPDTGDRYKTYTYTDDVGEKQTGLFDVITKQPVQAGLLLKKSELDAFDASKPKKQLEQSASLNQKSPKVENIINSGLADSKIEPISEPVPQELGMSQQDWDSKPEKVKDAMKNTLHRQQFNNSVYDGLVSINKATQ